MFSSIIFIFVESNEILNRNKFKEFQCIRPFLFRIKSQLLILWFRQIQGWKFIACEAALDGATSVHSIKGKLKGRMRNETEDSLTLALSSESAKYLNLFDYRTRAKRPTSWIDRPIKYELLKKTPLVVQFILLRYFWMHLHKINIFRKFHWDWLRFCMRFCNLKVQNLVLKMWKVNKPTAVYSSAYGM